MPLVPMKQILDNAIEKNYGVGAFNINNMEQTLAIMSAADRTESPVILQASRGARKYAGSVMIYGLVQAAMKLYPNVVVSLHLDHGNIPASCKEAMDDGWTSVMMDGSLDESGKIPTDFETNLRVTAEVVQEGHARGITVEGELGTLGGVEDGHGSDQVILTDPVQAAEFAEITQVDALALGFGTSHGAFKFKAAPELRYDIVEAVNKANPKLALVSHGSSSVPPDLVAIVNKYGGSMPGASGVPVDQIVNSIDYGVRKINIDTDLRIAATGAIRTIFSEKPQEFDVRKYLEPAMEAMSQVVEDRMVSFRTAGKASGIGTPITLEAMAASYKTDGAFPDFDRIKG
jgi:fructose-bisphosphate aldolase, class II